MSREEYFKARRALKRGGPARVPKPCGTVAAAQRHKRASEPMCVDCSEAWRQHQADNYQARKQRNAEPA